MNALGRMISIILAIILILFLPIQYIAESQVETMDHIVENYTREFTDNIRHKGKITLEDYEEYLHKINQTGELYHVDIEYATPKTLGDLTLNLQEDTRLASVNTNNLNFMSMNEIQSLSIEIGGYGAEIMLNAIVTDYNSSKYRYKRYLFYSNDGGKTWGEPFADTGWVSTLISPSNHQRNGAFGPDGCFYYLSGIGNSTDIYKYNPSTNTKTLVYNGFSSSIQINGIFYVNGMFFAPTRDTKSFNYIYYSLDGKTWIRGSSIGSSSYISDIVYGNGVYVASGYRFESDPDVPNRAVAYYSSDGVNWTRSFYGSFDGENTTGKVIFAGDRFILGNSSNSQIYTSYDGATWTYIKRVPNVSETTHIAYGNNILLFHDTNGGNIVTSMDYFETYNRIPSGYVNKNIAFNNGYFYMCSRLANTTNPIKRSIDGITWTDLSPYPVLSEWGTKYFIDVCNIAFNGTGDPKIPIKLEVTPTSQSIKKYENPSFDVIAYYDDETSEVLSETDYTIIDFDNKKIGEQTVTISFTYNEVTVTCQVSVIVTPMTTTCTICGHEYELDNNDKDNGCPYCSSTIIGIEASPEILTVNYGSALPVTVYAIYRNGGRSIINDWTSNYDSSKLGYQQVTITYKEFKDYITVEVKALQSICSMCGNAYSLYPDGSDPGCPICKSTVVSIKAEPNQITIGLHEALNLEVTATFQDGHTEVVHGWFTDLIPDKPGTFNVTVFYKNVTDQITVIVRDNDFVECEYCGENYSKSKYPECPTCAITIVGIEAFLRNEGSKVIKGTDLDLDIILIFKDTHREITNTGYTVSGYQPELIGEQTVTIHYKEFQSTLTIEVIDNFSKVTCPNGHEYYINEDGSDPGCPYCLYVDDSEQRVVYYDINYTIKILETLYSQKVFEMKAGDYITIIITKKNKSIRSQIMDLFRSGKKMNDTLTCGGEIIG